MRKIVYILVSFILLALHVSAQRIATFEMRYITSDTKANGDSDFHGETEWMNLDQRIDFLNKYAAYSAEFWGNPQLSQPLLAIGEAQGVVQNIKPQPLTKVRRTLRLSDWQAYGHRPGKAEEQRQQWRLWASAPEATIANGGLKLNNGSTEREVGKIDWRFKFNTTLDKLSPNFTLAFNKGDKTLLSIVLATDKIMTQSGRHKQTAPFNFDPKIKLEIYGDIPNHRFFVTVNGETILECPIDTTLEQEINRIKLTSLQGETVIDDILLFNFTADSTNQHTPYYTSLLLDEDFEEVLPIDGWQNPTYNDQCWQTVNLPSAHGGLREREESYYLRKKVHVKDFGRAVLKLETLDPGGEVWINGQPVAVINNRHPYDLDVTDYLKPNSENLIAVRVKPYKARHLMLHSPSDPYIGWQLGRTELILTDRCMIKNVFVHTASIADNQAMQTNQIILQYPGVYSCKGNVEVNYYSWYPTEGEKVASTRQDIEIRPAIDNKIIINLPIRQPKLWQTEQPNLYKVEVILRNEKGEAIDDYMLTTGIRTIEQRNGTLYVNNKAEMLNGAQIMGNRYPIETIAKTNRCVSDETVAQDLLMIKKMNGNMLRIHVHAEKDTIDGINDPRYAEFADQLGVYLLWQTAGWMREGEAWNVDFEGYPKFMKQVYNHPSIVMWEASNHPNRFKKHDISDSNDYMERIFHTISSADTSRLISPTSFWQHTHYGNYDGTKDYKGNPMTPTPVLMEKLMTRGSQDAYTGYGADWSYLRKAPHSWAASCLAANDKCYFNFEHEESAAQPNWELVKKEPWYKLQSYEWGYEEGSIGRKLNAEEWRISQAFQAFSAWESMKKQTLLGYDGFSWCSLESGANMFTYQKPLVDAMGVPKLAFYANKQVFNRIWAASDNVDVVYGPNDSIAPVIFNLGDERTVHLSIELKNEKGKTVERRSIKNIHIDKGRSITKLNRFQFKPKPDGCYFIVYTITEARTK